MANEFDLPGVVPWGRTASEYRAFFDLGSLPAGVRILDCGGGPSSFTAEMSAAGWQTVAVDPLYRLPGPAIKRRFNETRKAMIAGVVAAKHRFVWTRHESPQALERTRTRALNTFLEDFASSGRQRRYVAGSVAHLPFAAAAFDLVLCSHLLFLYSHALDLEFHLLALAEMSRVGREVRIFPLLDLEGRRSHHLDAVLEHARAWDVSPELRTVDYEFQRGGNQMLRVARSERSG